MYRTAARVWNQLWVFPIGIAKDGLPQQNRNIIVLATDGRGDRQQLLGRIANRVGGMVTVSGFERFGEDLHVAPIVTTDVPVLTDAHAPTDSLIRID
jgi:hypothetical protein